MRALLDTNILFSVVVYPESSVAQALAFAINHGVELFVASASLDELTRSLNNKTAQRAARERNLDLPLRAELVLELCTVVDATPSTRYVDDDPDDDWIISAAIAAAVDVIVTGDKAILAMPHFDGIRTASPREFAAMIEARSTQQAGQT